MAGALILALSLSPLAPALAAPGDMPHCASTNGLVIGQAPAAPCHAGDMTGCTHAATCASGPVAVVPASAATRLTLASHQQPLPLILRRPERFGFKPPTPPPNR